MVENCPGLHRRTLSPGRITRRNSVRPGSPTRITLRARTNLKDRNPAKIEATLRRENDPRHPFYGWLMRIARYF